MYDYKKSICNFFPKLLMRFNCICRYVPSTSQNVQEPESWRLVVRLLLLISWPFVHPRDRTPFSSKVGVSEVLYCKVVNALTSTIFVYIYFSNANIWCNIQNLANCKKVSRVWIIDNCISFDSSSSVPLRGVQGDCYLRMLKLTESFLKWSY